MSELYTMVMEKVMPVLMANWQLAIIGFGALFFVGAIRRWKWVCDPQGTNPQSLAAAAYRNFGEKGYRAVTGASGAVIMILGSLAFFFYR